MKRFAVFILIAATIVPAAVWAQGLRPEPVFGVKLAIDREPAVAGDAIGLAIVVTVDRGWHVNSDNPGDEFSMPTTVKWTLPDGWPDPAVQYPDGELLTFEFSESPIEVWEGRVVIHASLEIPTTAAGGQRIEAVVTAQACNDTQCLPPVPVKATTEFVVAAPGSPWQTRNDDLFEGYRIEIIELQQTPERHQFHALLIHSSGKDLVALPVIRSDRLLQFCNGGRIEHVPFSISSPSVISPDIEFEIFIHFIVEEGIFMPFRYFSFYFIQADTFYS